MGRDSRFPVVQTSQCTCDARRRSRITAKIHCLQYSLRAPIALAIPAQEPRCDIMDIVSIYQRLREAKGQGSVIRPRSRWLVPGAIARHSFYGQGTHILSRSEL